MWKHNNEYCHSLMVGKLVAEIKLRGTIWHWLLFVQDKYNG